MRRIKRGLEQLSRKRVNILKRYDQIRRSTKYKTKAESFHRWQLQPFEITIDQLLISVRECYREKQEYGY